MEWTEKRLELLRALWAEGLSTSEIGRRMGISKNAVVGKAHRMNLPARPSPIRRGGNYTPRPPKPLRAKDSTLPPLAIESEIPVQAAPAPTPPTPKVVPVEKPETPKPRPAAPAQSMTPRKLRIVACCWPIGEPGTPSFRFCDADARPGKSYCFDHHATAHVKIRDRREDEWMEEVPAPAPAVVSLPPTPPTVAVVVAAKPPEAPVVEVPPVIAEVVAETHVVEEAAPIPLVVAEKPPKAPVKWWQTGKADRPAKPPTAAKPKPLSPKQWNWRRHAQPAA